MSESPSEDKPRTGDAGPPKKWEEDEVAAPGTAPPSREELDERDRRMPTKRKPMGPTREERAEERPGDAEPPPADVPPTAPESD
jgi:hypothetical protein